MLGPLSFGFLVSATSYGTGWLADAVALALGALILLAGRRMLLAGHARPTGPVRDLPHGTDQPVTTRETA
jgi:dipeptide/tripeptide permease